MTVWIVIRFKGSGYEVDAVFNNLAAAQEHQRTITKRWGLSEIIEQKVLSI